MNNWPHNFFIIMTPSLPDSLFFFFDQSPTKFPPDPQVLSPSFWDLAYSLYQRHTLL